MEPLDPLDQLLRGRAAVPWSERVRSIVGGRWPWLLAGAVVTVVVVAVLVVQQRPTSGDVTLPRAGGGSGSVPVTSSPSGGPSSAPGSPPGPSGPGSSGQAELVVHVAGAVNTPGLVSLPVGSRVADAVARAGGLRADADGDRINLAAPLVDGVRVFIPAVGQPDPPAVSSPAAAPGSTTGSSAPAAPVDINRASAAELDALPGVGPSTAAAIIAYREEHGRFRSVDELQEVRGIGPAKFDSLESSVTVGP